MSEYFVGVDLGGTRIKIGLVCDGVIIDKVILPAESGRGLAATLPFIRRQLDQLLEKNDIPASSFRGIGLGFPGLVDPKNKKALSTNAKYDDALGIDLSHWVNGHWDVPFFIDNDARMAAVGEWKYGAGQNTENLVVMTIGTGIGTSAIIEGRLLRGKHFQAGCLGGHFAVQYDGRLCTCGNIGCMEAYASTWSIKERLVNDGQFAQSILKEEPVIDFEALFRAAGRNDSLAVKMRDDCIDVWAAGIISLIHAYDPEVVVVGGGVMNNQKDIIPFLVSKIERHAWCPWGKVEIKASKLMSDAGILGVVHCLQHEV